MLVEHNLADIACQSMRASSKVDLIEKLYDCRAERAR